VSDILDKFFYPRGILFVGASSDPRKLGGRPVDQTLRLGFAGNIYPVNPGSAEVQGLKAYASVADAPDDVDLAVIAVPARGVEAAVAACADKGVPLAAILSAGFAERDEEGRQAQERILELARKAGMRLIGPNSMGGMSFETRFSATFTSIGDHTGKDWPPFGPVSVASQSGFVGSHLMAVLRDRGLGVAKWAATGNQADIDVADVIDHMARDTVSRIIVVYLEGTTKPDLLRAALARARAKGKPVIVLKAGRSDLGAQAVAAHTASLVGGYEVYAAVFRQAGAILAGSIAELIELTAAFAGGRQPAGSDMGIVTGSGGLGILAADEAARRGFALPALPTAGGERIRAVNPLATVRNPVDMGSLVGFDVCVEALAESGLYDVNVMAIGHFGQLDESMVRLHRDVSRIVAACPNQYFCLVGRMSEHWVRQFQNIGVYVSEELVAAIGAIAKVRDTAAAVEVGAAPVAGEKRQPPPQLELSAYAGGEAAAKRLAEAIGIAVTADILASDAEAAVVAAAGIGGAVVLKISSPDIAHKSDAGGVRVGVEGAEAVRAAFAEICANASAFAPNARIEGVLVSPMVRGGTEVILGVRSDPAFGAAVMLGLGGVFVEIFGDTALRVPPFDRAQALAMIRELKAWPLLAGARGRPLADVDALADALVRLGAFAQQYGRDLEAFEINPLIVLPQGQGAIAVDALLTLPGRE